MEKSMKKQENGITLIALVITIIILLILAGVTISIVMNSGVIEKSQTAANDYNYEQAREKLRLAILEYNFAGYAGEQEEFEQIIENIGGTAEPKENGGYDVTIDGYDFKVEENELKIGSSKKEEPKVYPEGAVVKVKNGDVEEEFYVIKDNGNEVTLLAAKNIDISTLTQSESANVIAFSSANYWRR